MYYRQRLDKTEESRVLRQFGKDMGFELTTDLTANRIWGLVSNVQRRRTEYSIHATIQGKIREMAERAEGELLAFADALSSVWGITISELMFPGSSLRIVSMTHLVSDGNHNQTVFSTEDHYYYIDMRYS